MIKAEKMNPESAETLQKHAAVHSYGLVFEDSPPECTVLWKKKPEREDFVHVLPPRGGEESDENRVRWLVKDVNEEQAIMMNDLGEIRNASIEDIAVIAGWKDSIYPGLKEIDRIERGKPDDPFQILINSENCHALQALTRTCAGAVDCIYIDPPYNKPSTKDWKYKCSYVDSSDEYRHSKWLAFMKRRLLIAKKLLNQEKSILILTIDEAEVNRTGLLLEQTFPSARMQMISSVVNHASVARMNDFNRNNEYIFFVMIGSCRLNPIDASTTAIAGKEAGWNTLRRHSPSNLRNTRPNQFYPVYVNIQTRKIEEIGEPIPPDADRRCVPQREGCAAVFPVRDNGTEMLWGVIPSELKRRASKGYVRIGKYEPERPQQFGIQVLTSGSIQDIEDGKLEVIGRRDDGSVVAVYKETKSVLPKTQWDYISHDSKTFGSNMIGRIFNKVRFPYPKSLYAVFDCLKIAVKDNPQALVVDFFAGSGTTLHAINLLNAIDNGKRQCICITSNEVSAEEETMFAGKGLRPSDEEWEKFGTANYVAWPRTKCFIEGIDAEGGSLDGEYGCQIEEYEKHDGSIADADTGRKLHGTFYRKVKRPLYPEMVGLKMADGFNSNAVFCELTYESRQLVQMDQAFRAIAPFLWIQAGARGSIISEAERTYAATQYYAVLFSSECALEFCEHVESAPSIKTVFIAVDDIECYQNVCRRLTNAKVIHLPQPLISAFEIAGEGNAGR